MTAFSNGTVFNYEDQGELRCAAGVDDVAPIDPIRCEIENELAQMKISKLDQGLTNSAAFYRALKKAQAGDPTWEEDFDLVGSSLLISVRQAMKKRCALGAVEAKNKELLKTFEEQDRARVRAHNAAVEARLRSRLGGLQA